VATFTKSECEINFSAQFNTQASNLGATRANILRLLRSVDLVGWNTHEESGRLDRKAFTRFATGSTAVFSKRQYVEATKSAVSVLIDCSGSMSESNKIQTAESIAIQLSRILDKANVDFNVTGFFGNGGIESIHASGALAQSAHARIENVAFIPFKTWKENLAKASAKLGSIRQWARNSTPDYSALTITIEDLYRQDAQRKILFLLTDADGYCKAHMRHLQSVADRLGVKIVAIGIGDTSVRDCFVSGEDVKDVSGLASASFNKLLKELR
jgi:cobalamin biosynthesis protein CobT